MCWKPEYLVITYIREQAFFLHEQAEFRNNFRTTDQIFILKTVIDKYIQKEEKTINYLIVLLI